MQGLDWGKTHCQVRVWGGVNSSVGVRASVRVRVQGRVALGSPDEHLTNHSSPDGDGGLGLQLLHDDGGPRALLRGHPDRGRPAAGMGWECKLKGWGHV